MEHYVTLFDSLFLPQGLSLHMSMERHVKNYNLWILCVDDKTHEVLIKLDLPNVRLLELSKFETPELRQAKLSRSKGEYCWTLTPFASRFVFEADKTIKRVTYLDADIWFRKDPHALFEEFEASGKKVLITDHAYSPECDQSYTSGQYCVQFLIFDRSGGESVRLWWEEKCIEWCYAETVDGKFGDQKYLDDWPERFNSLVHVLKCKETILGPWNATRFPYGNSVIYHFHNLRLLSSKYVWIGNYYLPKVLINNVYKNYLKDLRTALSMLELTSYTFKRQADWPTFPKKLLRIATHIFGNIKRIIQCDKLKF